MIDHPCIICNAPITFLSRRRTCSLKCDQEAKRQKWKRADKRRSDRLRAARGQRFCQTCNVDISWKRQQAHYCSKRCWMSAYQAQQRKINHARVWLCRKCNAPVSSRRFVCGKCLQPKKRKSGWINWVNNGKTLEERMRRKQLKRQAGIKHRQIIRAANAVYRELQGQQEQGSVKKPPLPPATCVVCGIALTDFRKRILCGAQSCKEARDRERYLYYYADIPYSATPRMIAAANRKGNGKFRDIKPQQRTGRRRPRAGRSQREYAVYVAMRELNLLPTMEDGR